ncbi:hypothetical protein FSP39_016023 [Pinctada imbricata]|uniref:2-methoxy-6-polyprenyl-1,4-benzoquinol methylase, mitochondrial n=1 Tax=Pinctada imbricata TaxID=66713 RepID=A0AA89BVZ3_PINIB|nr:hypothetical protein FSP39_016023 [Pinctada imbricata]
MKYSTKESDSFNEESLRTQKDTHFGFESVPENEKEKRVYEVFKNVASKYDLMNDAMSAGVHRLWKDHFIQRMAPYPGTKLIDVAGGTGDIAFRFLNHIQSQINEDSFQSKADEDFEFPESELTVDLGNKGVNSSEVKSDSDSSSSDSSGDVCDDVHRDVLLKGSHVTVCDINQEMLDVGKHKALQCGMVSGISWLQGNAEELPVDSNSYDVYTIAFGIRNCTHVDKVIEEAYRVLKPGGRFMCLEFSQVPNPILRSVYDSYSFQVIPVMGQVLARDWRSYQYLVESIRQFPDQETFASMIRQSGFSMVTYENLTFGVAAIHSGFKLS